MIKQAFIQRLTAATPSANTSQELGQGMFQRMFTRPEQPSTAPASGVRRWRQRLLALPLALGLAALTPLLVSPPDLQAATQRLALPAAQKAEAKPAPQTLRRYALIIGANQGGPSRPPLKYAHTDAQAFARVLEEMGGVGAQDRLLLLEPSRASLDKNLEALSQRLKAEQHTQQRSELVLYYSGHSDETGIMLGNERWSYPEIGKPWMHSRQTCGLPFWIRAQVVP